jgi:hypothetical protein
MALSVPITTQEGMDVVNVVTTVLLNTLVVAPPVPDAPDLVADLLATGAEVCERCTGAEMVRAAVRHAPDLIVCWEPQPGESFFEAVRLVSSVAPAAFRVEGRHCELDRQRLLAATSASAAAAHGGAA